MEYTLELVFKAENGDSKVVSVTDPRTDVSATEAREAMEALIAADVIESTGGKLVEAVEARMRVTEVTVLV